MFGILVLLFDQPLQAGPLNAFNWSVEAISKRWTCDVIDAGVPVANAVTGAFTQRVPPEAPGTRVNYRPPPFDVLNGDGVPALAFEDFPLTPFP